MEHAKLYLVNVRLCTTFYFFKWIQLQYGGKCYSNLGAFHVNQPSRTLGEMSLEGTNYVQDFPKLLSEIEQYHVRKMCLK
jgi:hypothetical protein